MIQQIVYYNIVRYILINYNTFALLSRALRSKMCCITAHYSVQYSGIHYNTFNSIQNNKYITAQ